jgi:hypothetical protein
MAKSQLFYPSPCMGRQETGCTFINSCSRTERTHSMIHGRSPQLISNCAPIYWRVTPPCASLISLHQSEHQFLPPIGPWLRSAGQCLLLYRQPQCSHTYSQICHPTPRSTLRVPPPDATCNPYLAMAAMLLAGIDGIEQGIDPTAAGYGPINEDIFSWSPEKRERIKSLPTSLGEALSALEKDHEFLTKNGVVPERLIEQWLAAKSREEQAVRSRPHPYEIQLYFDL